jgi:hypothetical protein
LRHGVLRRFVEQRRRCHTLAACPIASSSLVQLRIAVWTGVTRDTRPISDMQPAICTKTTRPDPQMHPACERPTIRDRKLNHHTLAMARSFSANC